MAEGKIHCPGVGDDTANLALMLLIVRYLLENDHMPSQGALFVANSCEEGLGKPQGLPADHGGITRGTNWLPYLL